MKLTVDSPWIQTGTKITNLLILNACFTLGCLPVFTIGASLTATFDVAMKIAQEREDVSIIRSFVQAYRANFKRGMGMGLVLGLVGWCVWLDGQIAFQIGNAPIAAWVVFVLGLLLLYVHALYAFALEARYENTWFMAFINSRKIATRFFVPTLGLSAALTAEVFLFWGTAPFLTYCGLFCAPVCLVYTICKTLLPILRTLDRDAKASDGFSVNGR